MTATTACKHCGEALYQTLYPAGSVWVHDTTNWRICSPYLVTTFSTATPTA